MCVCVSVCVTWLLVRQCESVSDVPAGPLLFLMVNIPAEGQDRTGQDRRQLLLHWLSISKPNKMETLIKNKTTDYHKWYYQQQNVECDQCFGSESLQLWDYSRVSSAHYLNKLNSFHFWQFVFWHESVRPLIKNGYCFIISFTYYICFKL